MNPDLTKRPAGADANQGRSSRCRLCRLRGLKRGGHCPNKAGRNALLPTLPAAAPAKVNRPSRLT
jgi:hypothetical protein